MDVGADRLRSQADHTAGQHAREFPGGLTREKAAAADGYYAYYGTWTVDASAPSVTHHIDQSFYPAERGEAGTRHLALSGNRLELTAKAHEMGEDHQRRLVWERILP